MTGEPRSNIVVAGFMCSGKTTVGKLVARLTGRRFVDTDEIVEERALSTVAAIFEREGEEAFRRLERSVVSEVARLRDTVIALGGGAVLDPENVDDCSRGGVVYYLEVSPELVIERRGPAGSRPLLEGLDASGVARLISRRLPAYLDAADVVVHAGNRSPDDIAAAIAADFEDRLEGAAAGRELL